MKFEIIQNLTPDLLLELWYLDAFESKDFFYALIEALAIDIEALWDARIACAL